MWGAGKREAQRAVDHYFSKLASAEIPRDEELAQCYAAKIVLDTVKDSESRVRAIQSLANLPHPACILPLVRELMARAKRWPHAANNVDMESVSTLLLESLVRYSKTSSQQPPDAPISTTSSVNDSVSES
jgi:hypothetical protein